MSTPAVVTSKPDDVTWAQHLSLTCDRLAWTGGLRQCPKCDGDIPDGFLFWCSYECYCRFLYDHYWTNARKRSIRKHGGRCAVPGCRTTKGLQVNHIVPIADSHKERLPYDCRNHQDNLQPLCRDHHALVTAAQSRRRHGIVVATDAEVLEATGRAVLAENVCGSPTRSGRTCTRWTDPGTRCWQHGGVGVRTSGRLGEHW